MDTAKKWYQCLIVGVKEEVRRADGGRDGTHIVLLGRAQDGVAKVKVSFVGWSCKYDEWVPRTSPGLARLNSRSYGLRGKGAVAVTEADQELVVDDADDPAGVWAVRRRGARTSALLVENVAFFGQIHGFNTFVTRIGSDPPIPITIVRGGSSHVQRFLCDTCVIMLPAAPRRIVVDQSHSEHHDTRLRCLLPSAVCGRCCACPARDG